MGGRVGPRREPKPYVRTLSDAAWRILNAPDSGRYTSYGRVTREGLALLEATKNVEIIEGEDGFVFSSRVLPRSEWMPLWLRGEITRPTPDGKARWLKKTG